MKAIGRALYAHPRVWLAVLLVPPLVWLGVVYLGSLAALLTQSLFHIDDFSGVIVREPSLTTYKQLVTTSANVDIIVRTLLMALAVTLASAVVAFPIAYHAAFFARGRAKALFYLAVMLPMWASYLVKVYAWRQVLAREGIVTWMAEVVHLRWVLEGILGLPVVGGPSLSASQLGTFIVFTYMWLPYMILPIQAALERVPPQLLSASADLGAKPRQTFMRVVLPLSLPGVIAGSIFTFSLTLGDYIIPGLVGAPGYFIGMMVYLQQGTAGNIPLAAAFSVVPMVIIGIYLVLARRAGAFDAL